MMLLEFGYMPESRQRFATVTLILIYGLVFKENTTFSAKLLFGFSYIDKFSAFGIKICNTFLDDICLFHGLLDK